MGGWVGVGSSLVGWLLGLVVWLDRLFVCTPPPCSWRELPQVSFLSRQTHVSRVCPDKTRILSRQIFVAMNIMNTFLATSILLSRQTRLLSRQTCRDKHTFVATKDKFVATKHLSRQKLYLWKLPLTKQEYACCDKSMLVATKRLSREIFG